MSVSPAILCVVCLVTTVLCDRYGDDGSLQDDRYLAEDEVYPLDPADVKVYTTEEKMLERHDNGGLNIPHSYKGVVVANIQAHGKASKPYPVTPTEQLLDSSWTA